MDKEVEIPRRMLLLYVGSGASDALQCH
jgi:hypothetical protein